MMDQLDFENYVEKMKNRQKEGDFKTAAKIADKIDWERVEDINLLIFASTIYEDIKDYDSAKALLEYAYSIAPVKNRLYYALCSINIKARDIKEARNYYIDFCQSFPEDNRKQLLKYYLLTARGAAIDQRIRILKEYVDEEKAEDLIYELALLYEKDGDIENVIKTCDHIVDFFGVKINGYGKDALILKSKYKSLNDYEKGLLEDHEYVMNMRSDDKEHNSNYEMGEDERIAVIEKEQDEDNPYGTNRILEEDIKRQPPIEKIPRKKEKIIKEEPEVTNEHTINFVPDLESYNDEELKSSAFLKDEEQKDKLRRLIASIKREEENKYSSKGLNREKKFTRKRRFNDMKIDDIKLHMIIEANSNEEGVAIAKEELNYIHKTLGDNIKTAKTSAYNVNDKKFDYYLQKLGNRDLIIENAGRLKNEAIDDIEEFMLNKNHKNIIVLVDVINNFDRLASERATFVDRFDIYSVLSDVPQENLEKTNRENIVEKVEENRSSAINIDESKIITKNTPYEVNMDEIKQNNVERIQKKKDDDLIKIRVDNSLIDKAIMAKQKIKTNDEQRVNKKQHMTKDEFVEFCKNYAKSIDCVMPGKSIPALYEKVEDMIEDGIDLTEENGIELMEEVADRAEKPKLFSKPKYDKDGCLILLEEHFA